MRHYKNKRGSYGLKSKEDGKIVATFRLYASAIHMKRSYENILLEKLEVVKI